jgi:hypothetical protein
MSLVEYKNAQFILNSCMEHMDFKKLNLFTFILALINAADAVEVTSVGYIVSEMRAENLSYSDKGNLLSNIYIFSLCIN